MPCSVCFETSHNKRTCPLQHRASIVADSSPVQPAPVSKSDIAAPAEISITKDLSKLLPSKRICSMCGECGHNKRTCQPKIPPKTSRKCSECGECGHNKRTCLLVVKVNHKKCSVCEEMGHNSRTCNMKCHPCDDQVARSYCFAGMTAKQAVKMTKILECASIYGETEEYPQFVESPPVQRKTEHITNARGEKITLDLGPVA